MKQPEIASADSGMAGNRTLLHVSFYAFGVGLYSLLAVWKEETHLADVTDLPSDIHAALTLVLGWLLVFRTNSSYARWWEARTLWGRLVNASRNLAIKVADLVKGSDEELDRFRIDIVAFAFALRDHLREASSLQSLDGFGACPDQPSHVPSYLVTRMYEEFGNWHTSGRTDSVVLRILDVEAREFLEICGGCERIRNTRVVRSYRTFSGQCRLFSRPTRPQLRVNRCRGRIQIGGQSQRGENRRMAFDRMSTQPGFESTQRIKRAGQLTRPF